MLQFETRQEMMKQLVGHGQKICEVGVFLGEFANFLLTLQPKQLVLIDPWEGIGQSGDHDGNNVKQVYLPAAYMNIMSQTKGLPFIFTCRGKSGEILPMWKDGTFDCVYLDGDHSYEGVKIDLPLAWAKLRPGGWLMGHDYETNPAKTKTGYAFGVKKAVDEFLEANKLKIHALAMDGCVSFAVRKPEDVAQYVELADPAEFVAPSEYAKNFRI